jgi:hypothetical protein
MKVVEKTGRSLDWLQRVQALWSALPHTVRTWIKGTLWYLGTAAGALIAGKVSSLDPVQVYALAVIAGAAAAIGYAGWHNLRRPVPASQSLSEPDAPVPATETPRGTRVDPAPSLQEQVLSEYGGTPRGEKESRVHCFALSGATAAARSRAIGANGFGRINRNRAHRPKG